MKITPAMIEAARRADPAFADVPDQSIRAALRAALDAAPGAKPAPALIAGIVTNRATQRNIAIPQTIVHTRKPRRW